MLLKHSHKLAVAFLLLVITPDLFTALNIKSPIIENALFSEKVYKTVVGKEVQCRMQLDETDNIVDYAYNAVLVLENNRNKKIEHSKGILSAKSHIRINTETLNISDTYSCCLEMSGNQKKCSVLVISPYLSSHFTIIAKMIGLLEMLVLIGIFSVCLMCSVMRFKSRHLTNKVVDANLKEFDTMDLEKFGSGPYIITPNAQNAMDTNVSNAATDLKSIVLQDADPKSVDRVTDGDFPPSYEELIIRRMSKKLTAPVKY